MFHMKALRDEETGIDNKDLLVERAISTHKFTQVVQLVREAVPSMTQYEPSTKER